MMLAADKVRDSGNLLHASALYELAANRFPRFTGAWVQLGNMSKDIGDHERAGAAYARALALDPDNADIHLQLGHLAKLQGRINDAVRAYEKSQRLDPSSENAARELANISCGQIAEASGRVDLPSGAELIYRRLALAFSMRRQ
jgi:predicted TPR repeat methyltransferase